MQLQYNLMYNLQFKDIDQLLNTTQRQFHSFEFYSVLLIVRSFCCFFSNRIQKNGVEAPKLNHSHILVLGGGSGQRTVCFRRLTHTCYNYFTITHETYISKRIIVANYNVNFLM